MQASGLRSASQHRSKWCRIKRAALVKANPEAIMRVDFADPGDPTIDPVDRFGICARADIERNTSTYQGRLATTNECTSAAEIYDSSQQGIGLWVVFIDSARYA